jgi:adenine deaminase
MDAHIHIESTHLTPYSFGWTVIRYGTTAVFIDPHEIANVAGDKGIRLMIRDGYRSPLKFFITYPSCVPAAANIDTSGAVFTSKDIEKGLRHAEVVALGEMMNFPGVISCNKDVLEKIGLALRWGYVIEGHIVGVSKRELAAYFASGISSDHESIECAEAIEKLRHGIYLYARESAFSKDLRTIVRCILDKKMDTRHLVLVSDDIPAEELVSRGHVDNLLRLAIETGLDPIRAIQAVTINVAEHYGLSLELGSVAPLRFGDIAVFEDLETVRIKHVISDGQIVVYNGELVVDKPRRPRYPKWATNTVILPKGLSIDRLRILVDEHEGRVKVHVMKPEALITRDLHIEMRVVDGEVTPDPDRDIARISVIERHGKDGGVGNGFIMAWVYVQEHWHLRSHMIVTI